MKINETDLITVPRSRKPGHYQFIGASDARIINSLDEAALIRLWTGDPSPARAAKSPTARAQFLRPIRGKSSRASRETTAGRCKINDPHDRYQGVHESVRHSVAKTLLPLFGTHFPSRQSSPGSPA